MKNKTCLIPSLVNSSLPVSNPSLHSLTYPAPSLFGLASALCLCTQNSAFIDYIVLHNLCWQWAVFFQFYLCFVLSVMLSKKSCYDISIMDWLYVKNFELLLNIVIQMSFLLSKLFFMHMYLFTVQFYVVARNLLYML